MTNWYGSLWLIWRTNAATQDSLPILPDTPYIHVIMRPLGHPNENCQKLEWTNKEGNMKIPCKLNKKDVTTKPTLVLYAYFSKTWVISCLRCCNLLSWDLPSSKLSPLCVTIIYKLIYSIPMLSVYAHLLNLLCFAPFLNYTTSLLSPIATRLPELSSLLHISALNLYVWNNDYMILILYRDLSFKT